MYLKYFKKFIKYFGHKRKLKLFIFVLMALIAGGLEFAGVAMIYPFVMLIVNPESINSYIKYFPNILATSGSIALAFIIGFIAMGLFIFKNIYMMIFMYVQCKFLQKWTQAINNYFMDFFIYAPYKITQTIPNSEKLYTLNVLSSQATNGFIMRLSALITNVLIVACIITLIFIKFFAAGLISLLFVAITVLIQNKTIKKHITKINSRIVGITKQLNILTYANINNIKAIKINGVEKEADHQYEQIGKTFTDVQYRLNFFSAISPYMVETIVVISLIVLGIIISYQNQGQQQVLVASYAMIVAAIFRIAPALNRIQSNAINLPSTLNFVIALTDMYEKYCVSDYKYSYPENIKNIEFNESIEFKNVNFSYVKDKLALKNISFTIKKGDFVGIIGLSGAGKSTLADIFTGLLPLDSGEILVDNIALTDELFYSFRKKVGYVPQDSVVFDCSFRENVAWCVPKEIIDDAKIEQILKSVSLWDVVSSYKDGMYSIPIVGDSGLSKGQMQRLSLARALYRDPEIILLDEATSALDVKIESEIVDMIKSLDKGKTIISIAHRLSVLKACNKLVYMKAGEIIDVGTFENLANKYSEFAELVRLSGIDAKNN